MSNDVPGRSARSAANPPSIADGGLDDLRILDEPAVTTPAWSWSDATARYETDRRS
jgi:hypothetical protein